MIAIVLQEKGGEARRLVFDKTEVIVGRVQGNDIVLPKGNVSKRHARISLGNGKIVVSDHKSTNGTYVNGRKITSPLVVRAADKIYIGDYILTVEEVPDEPKASLGWDQADNPSQVTPPIEEADDEIDLGMQSSASLNPESLASLESVLPSPPASVPAPPTPAPRPLDLPSFRGEPAPVGGAGILPPPGFSTAPRGPSSSGSSQGLAAAPFPRADSLAQPGPMPGLDPLRQPAARGAIPSFPGAGGPPPPASIPTPVVAPPHDPFSPPTATPSGASGAPPRLNVPTPSAGVAGMVGLGPDGGAVGAAPVAPPPRSRRATGARIAPRGFVVPPLAVDARSMLEVQQRIVDQVAQQLGIEGLMPQQLAEEALWQRAERAVNEAIIVAGRSGQWGDGQVDIEQLGRDALNEVLGWGLLEDFLSDDAVDAVAFDRYDSIAVRHEGQWVASGKAFSSEDSLRRILERIALAFGVPWQTGVIDVALRSGVRLTAVMPPASGHVAGTVRKVRAGAPRLDELVARGALTAVAAEYARSAIADRRGIAVIGPVASARIELVGALLAESGPGERLISIEDASELRSIRANHVSLERRGQDSATVLATAMALRPDRLAVLDPGLEALPVLATMATSLDGGVMAWSAASAAEGLDRLVALTAVGRCSDSAAVRQLVTVALPVVITCSADSNGDAVVTEIAELTAQGGQWRLEPVRV